MSQSPYNVDDLFIGKVSVLGIYKGKTSISRLKNTFEYFSELGSMQNGLLKSDDTDEIHDSQYMIEVLPLYIPKTLTFPINKSSTLYELSNSLSKVIGILIRICSSESLRNKNDAK